MIGNIVDKSALKELIEDFSQARSILIFVHKSPDGDAIGASTGLLQFIQLLNERATIHIIAKNEPPAFLRWVPAIEHLRIYDNEPEVVMQLIDDADMLCGLDFGDFQRAGDEMLPVIQQKKCKKIIIDHHPNPDESITTRFVFPNASATCEIVARLIYQYYDERGDRTKMLPKKLATSLYLGIMTDTGNFSYSANHREVFEVAGWLVSCGINRDEIYANVFRAYSLDRLRFEGYCLLRKTVIFDEKIALIALNTKELKQFNFQRGDSEGIVNLPLQVATIQYSVFLREERLPKPVNGHRVVVRVSCRSKGDRPVNIFCQDIFGGGGHKNASGGEFKGRINAAIAHFKKHYKKYLT